MRTNPKPNNKKPKMKRNLSYNGLSLLIAAAALLSAIAPAQAQDKKPNILFIMGDDIGMWNIGAYHRGLMAGRTPNLDKLAKEGMLFTDYYAEASCTAGRANFIMGELPIRTGMTTVGQAGAKMGIPAEACTLYPERMKTVDNEIRDFALTFIEKAKNDGKPFFCWLNPTRMHIVTHLSDKYEKMRNSVNGWSEEEAGMAQLDDDIGLVMQKLKDLGVDDNTIVVFTTDNGTELFTWPDGGTTPFAQCKGTVMEGGFRVPCILRWPGHVPADSVQNGIFSGLDWFPTFLAAASNPNITDQLLKGVKLGDRTYKNHLDGYNQMDCITGKGPSNRHEIFYLGESSVGAVRIDDYKYRFIDQPNGWLGAKTQVDIPYLINLRLDPFERQGWPNNGTKEGAQQYFDWFKFQFWRFVFVQQVVGKELQTFLDYPPMQKGASFNLEAVKAEMAKKMEQAQAAAKGAGQ